MPRKISAKIIADSINQWGHRIITYVLVYPRYIHSEFMTHRMFSRNAASSRAVPFKKMLQMIKNDPFIPVAWQKNHSGMQGTEYLIGQDVNIARDYWLYAMDKTVFQAQLLEQVDVTKQIINRLLEPFMWYTCIVTATEYDNFFDLRCPQYEMMNSYGIHHFKSRRDYLRQVGLPDEPSNYDNWTDLDWLKINTSAAEIHISLLAEAMWDARNESKPKELQPGEWHIPFGDNIDEERLAKLFADESVGFGGDQDEIDEAKIKIATARCARVSYLNFEGKDDYEDDLRLFKKLIGPPTHLSPFEHCAKNMTEEEYYGSLKGTGFRTQEEYLTDSKALEEKYGPEGMFKHYEDKEFQIPKRLIHEHYLEHNDERYGWCKNFRGYIQLRDYVEKGNFTF